MRARSKLLLTALTAAVLMGCAAGAVARRFEISNQRIRVVWPTGERLRFSGLVSIECEVTLEGSFHSKTFSKVSGQLIGNITRAAVTRPCAGGNAWALNGVEVQEGTVVPNTLPWHIRYDRFTGALPNITGIRMQLIGVAFLVQLGFSLCLYQSTAVRPAFGIFEIGLNGRVLTFIADEEAGATIPLKETIEGFCEATGRIARKASVMLLGSATTRISVRLVQ